MFVSVTVDDALADEVTDFVSAAAVPETDDVIVVDAVVDALPDALNEKVGEMDAEKLGVSVPVADSEGLPDPHEE